MSIPLTPPGKPVEWQSPRPRISAERVREIAKRHYVFVDCLGIPKGAKEFVYDVLREAGVEVEP